MGSVDWENIKNAPIDVILLLFCPSVRNQNHLTIYTVP